MLSDFRVWGWKVEYMDADCEEYILAKERYDRLSSTFVHWVPKVYSLSHIWHQERLKREKAANRNTQPKAKTSK